MIIVSICVWINVKDYDFKNFKKFFYSSKYYGHNEGNINCNVDSIIITVWKFNIIKKLE